MPPFQPNLARQGELLGGERAVKGLDKTAVNGDRLSKMKNASV
ncbi:MAG: hypothetical protein SFY66_13035 [Oculatellaceae cyanobacterium bins.114]|nr:hypothetical protein [Oculatellaceae cyanobacterium bins.114]